MKKFLVLLVFSITLFGCSDHTSYSELKRHSIEWHLTGKARLEWDVFSDEDNVRLLDNGVEVSGIKDIDSLIFDYLEDGNYKLLVNQTEFDIDKLGFTEDIEIKNLTVTDKGEGTYIIDWDRVDVVTTLYIELENLCSILTVADKEDENDEFPVENRTKQFYSYHNGKLLGGRVIREWEESGYKHQEISFKVTVDVFCFTPDMKTKGKAASWEKTIVEEYRTQDNQNWEKVN